MGRRHGGRAQRGTTEDGCSREGSSDPPQRGEVRVGADRVGGGAGGIGGPLIQRLQFRRWDEISMLLLVIIAFVVVVDAISSRLRRNLV